MTASVSRPRGRKELNGPGRIWNARQGKMAQFLILKSAPPTITMTGGEILSAPIAPQVRIWLFDNVKPPERPTDGVKLEIQRLDDQLPEGRNGLEEG